MPALPVKDRRLADFHLPEISRDDISRTLSGLHLPDVDMPDAISRLDWPSVDLSGDNVGKAVAHAGRTVSDAAAERLGRRRRRPRWALALGGMVVVGLATWAVLANDAIRSRISAAIEAVRDRLTGLTSAIDADDVDLDEATAFLGGDADPLGVAPYGDPEMGSVDEPDLPDADRSNGSPAFEEAKTPG